MHQGQGLELCGQRNMSSGSDLEYGMNRGAELVLTTNSLEILWRRWRTLAEIKCYMEDKFSFVPITWYLRALLCQGHLGWKLFMI